MAPGRSGRDSLGRCLRRRRADGHRHQRRRRPRQEVARAAAVGGSRAQHHLRLFPEGAGRGLSTRPLRFPDQQHRAAVRGHGLQGRQGQLGDPDFLPAVRCRRRARMAPSTSPTGSIRASAATTTRTTPRPGLSTASRRRDSNPWCRRSISATLEGQIDRAAQPGGQRARRGVHGAGGARRGRRCPRSEKLLADENPFIRARAVWLLARLGPEGVARVESAARRRGRDDCASPRIARCGRSNRALPHAARWRAIRRPRCAAKWRCRCATCRSNDRASCCSRWPRATTARTEATSRPGASVRRARKRSCTPRSPPTTRARRREMAGHVLGPGLAPHAARRA